MLVIFTVCLFISLHSQDPLTFILTFHLSFYPSFSTLLEGLLSDFPVSLTFNFLSFLNPFSQILEVINRLPLSSFLFVYFISPSLIVVLLSSYKLS